MRGFSYINEEKLRKVKVIYRKINFLQKSGTLCILVNTRAFVLCKRLQLCYNEQRK